MARQRFLAAKMRLKHHSLAITLFYRLAVDILQQLCTHLLSGTGQESLVFHNPFNVLVESKKIRVNDKTDVLP